jgi:ribonuclease E
VPPGFRLERLRAVATGEVAPPRTVQAPSLADEGEEPEEEVVEGPEAIPAVSVGEEERGRRRRPRRRRRVREPREPGAPREAEVEVPAAARDEEASHDSEADHRRRRRGRRGGRPRPPREEIAAAAEAVTPVAAEAVEDAPVLEEPLAASADIEPMPVVIAWPTERAIEGAHPAATSEVGEPPLTRAARAPSEPEPDPEPTAEAEEGVPFVSDNARVFEEAVAEAVPPLLHGEPEPGLPPLLHGEPEPGLPPRPNEEVLTVTEKPANPRRGWWQRLMQS